MKIASVKLALSRRWTALTAAALVAMLSVSCGGGAADGTSTLETKAATNTVVTTADRDVALEGPFEEITGYLSQGRTVMRGAGVGPRRAHFGLKASQAGYYEVFAWWPQAAAGAGVVDTEITHAEGSNRQHVDQSAMGGQWNSLGVYALDPRKPGTLSFSSPAGVRLYVDAIRFHWVGTERPALQLVQTQLEVADKDDPYNAQISARGGRGPYTYRHLGGRLPDGLNFDSITGRLQGVPAETGSFLLRVAVTDGDGRTAQGDIELEVVQSNDTPGSVPARSFQLQRERKQALNVETFSGAQLGNLPSIVRAMPEGSWAKLNLNQYSDVWVPADLRPLYGLSNPTPAKIITAWSSFAWDSNRGNLLLYGGGHANYRGNEVYLWRGATQMWERASLPSEMRQDVLGNWNAIDSADAAPASAHTYDNTLFFPTIDRMVVVGGAADSNGGVYLRLNTSTGTSRQTGFYLFDPARAHPDRVGGTTGSHVKRVAPWPEIVGGNMWSNRETLLNVDGAADLLKGGYVNGCAAYTKVDGKDVAYFRNANSVYRLTISNVDDPRTDTWEKVGVKWSGSGTKATCTYGSDQKLLLRTATQTVPFVYWNMASPTSGNRDVTVVPADPTGTFMPALASNAINIANCGLEYDPLRRNYKLWCGGGTVWQLTPPSTVSSNGWSIVPLAPTSTALPDPTVANGVMGKWKYIENLDAFMALQDSVQGNIWVYKPAGWVDPGGSGNQPPTVSLTQPLSGASFAEGTSITLAASAADPDGSVTKVEFFSGPTKLGEALSAPYALTWAGAPVGTHTLSARVTDDQGSLVTSASVNITVTQVGDPPPNQPPAVSLLQPAANAVFTAGQPIALAASAQDADGTVQKVEFYAGVLKIGESLASPYNFTWTGALAGTHMLTAIAHDDDGAQGGSQSISITVNPSTGLSQAVTIRRGALAGAAVADTYLSSYSTSKNYGTVESMLELGQYNMLLRVAIFQSEGGPVPNGATIESAVLSVYKWTSYAMTYGLHRMLQPWTETGATWNQRLSGAPWGAPGGKVVGVDYAAVPDALGSVGYDAGWVAFDITASVQQMSGSVVVANNGWRLQPTAGATSSLKRFHSSEYAADATLRPKLVITYR
jgi:hypothetical protein